MRLIRPWPATAAIALVGVLPLSSVEEREETMAPSRLIEALGDERYPERVRASRELWGKGDEVRDLLIEATESEDAEVALRARDVLRKIQLGILPDSPPQVVALVEQYDLVSPKARVKIIQQLKRLRAWKQVLRMHQLERDPATLSEIAEEMGGVSVMAARELLAEESPDYDAAREMLELGRAEPAQLMALADFHRVKGTLRSELRKARKLRGGAGHLWRFVLLSAEGRTLLAAKEAEAGGYSEAAARLRLLAGDPREWLEIAPIPPRQIVPNSMDAYRRSVIGLWEGEPVSDSMVSGLSSSVKDALDDESWHSLGLIFALGEADGAKELLGKMDTTLAFRFFETMEQVDDAHRAFGLDPENPDYGAWIEKRFRALIDDPDSSENALEELEALGGFLEARGLHEELEEAFVPRLIELGKKDQERFAEVCTGLASRYSITPVLTPVMKACAVYAGDDEDRWSFVRRIIFGESVYVDGLWESICDYQPDATNEERLELVACMLGRAPDLENRCAGWWEWQDGRAVVEGDPAQPDRYGLMLSMNIMKSDAKRYVALCNKVRNQGFDLSELGEYSDVFRFDGYEVFCLGAVGDWDKVVDVWQRVVNEEPSEPMKQAYLAGALRRAGRVKEADKQDAVVSRLALGDPITMRAIGQAYASSVDFERAYEWWMRAAVQSVNSDRAFFELIGLLAQESKNQSDWTTAAAVGEMNLLHQVMMGEVIEQPTGYLRVRLEIEMARAFSRLGEERGRSIATLKRCHKRGVTDGSMADFFFPGLREKGLIREHDEWFEQTWEEYLSVIERFPRSHNTMNTAAWTAARANRHLDEAEELLGKALERLPGQPAYLDTMGEIWFARRNREQALEWSRKAVNRQPGDENLMRQLDRFEEGSFPIK